MAENDLSDPVAEGGIIEPDVLFCKDHIYLNHHVSTYFQEDHPLHSRYGRPVFLNGHATG